MKIGKIAMKTVMKIVIVLLCICWAFVEYDSNISTNQYSFEKAASFFEQQCMLLTDCIKELNLINATYNSDYSYIKKDGTRTMLYCRGDNYQPTEIRMPAIDAVMKEGSISSIYLNSTVYIFYICGFGNFSAAQDYGIYYCQDNKPYCIDINTCYEDVPMKSDGTKWNIDYESIDNTEYRILAKHLDVNVKRICMNWFYYETYTR